MRISRVCWLALLCAGCAHTVNYKLTEADKWPGARIDKVVRVQAFADETPPGEKMEKPPSAELHQQATMVDKRTKQEGDYTWRFNYRDGYPNHEIANGVSAMIVKHLKYSGLFKNVVGGSSAAPADYELTGTIAVYRAEGRVNKGAEATVAAGSAFGAAGALLTLGATSGQTTEIRASVELRAVSLADSNQHTPVWTDTIVASTNFTASWMAADEPTMFIHADNCLKQAVADLIQRLGDKLSAARTTGN